ncbi:MAG: Rieske (2Fe-2S) protein [Ignavibacteriales bacterium]|nr:MAG: Plastoquinol--plastocyanin reductase [Stygiobacter sp.]KAF0214351.1 MAG: Plastoquinol--plastocyanin [Ignavibacteria bacterium]MBI3125181.1 Rieske (2Fe-2S) protein [Ignavibacteriales bacterium]RJQ65059.1 MAG: Rieske (2Fe-2S) protein [Stygiobacter sp.]
MKSSANNEDGRRNFLKYIINGGLIGFVFSIFYPLVSYLKPPKQEEVEVASVSAGKLDEFKKDSGKIIQFGSKPVILIRTQTDKLLAFDAVCTHLDCTVQYKSEMGVIWCACHNGKYDLNGKNISGPPPKPLQPYNVSLKGDEIIISKLS